MYYTKEDITEALRHVGIKKNDTIFFTTSLGMLGIPKIKGPVNTNKISKFILDGIKEVIGSKGTILVPTYSYSFGDSNEKKLPHFYRLISLIISGKSENLIMKFALNLKLQLPKIKDVNILGPVVAPITKIKKKYIQLVMRCKFIINILIKI